MTAQGGRLSGGGDICGLAGPRTCALSPSYLNSMVKGRPLRRLRMDLTLFSGLASMGETGMPGVRRLWRRMCESGALSTTLLRLS